MKLALVTGGTRGIGAAICRSLQAQGHRVVATYHTHDAEALSFTQQTHIPTLRWDVSNYEECFQGICKVNEIYGPIHILVNNAGVADDAPIREMTPQQWHRVIHINLSGVFFMSKLVIDQMCQQGYGRIISIGSINGSRSAKGIANYSASKAGLVGLTKALAYEIAPYGVTANVVAPGYIRTGLVEELPPSILERIMKKIPLKRMGIPEEVAAVVNFLASPAASFITGSTFHLNGGQFMN